MITAETIEEAEKETIQKVSRAISTLENALASWEASKDKPEDLEREFRKYKEFHDELERWEREMLIVKGEELNFFKRVERLRRFVNICHTFA
ncbi:MAG: hypothetical protein U0R44_03405 [Candidatus Micrarchaeia archaeon]